MRIPSYNIYDSSNIGSPLNDVEYILRQKKWSRYGETHGQEVFILEHKFALVFDFVIIHKIVNEKHHISISYYMN